MLSKEETLIKAKRWPLLLLCLASACFIASIVAQLWGWQQGWVGAIKSVSEAAMVGALADWFAVSALFRRLPLPLVGKHTGVIEKSKDEIATNLSRFVGEKFLNKEALLTLIRQCDPAQTAALWLRQSKNAALISRGLLSVLQGLLNLADDRPVQAFIRRAAHRAIDQIDLSRSVATLFDTLTKQGRYQALLDDAIAPLLKMINQPQTHQIIADQVVRWLKQEHPLKEKILPTSWLGEKSADVAREAVQSILSDIEHNKSHALRQGFDRAVARFVTQLKSDPQMQEKALEIKRYLKEDEKFNHYLGALWGDLRDWLNADLQQENPQLRQRMTRILRWAGETLESDHALRTTLNQHIESAVVQAAPHFAQFLSQHIRATVEGWNAGEMVTQIELNIGPALQRIRINGTLVGGIIGFLLWCLSQLPSLVSRL
ncbi:MAG: hypothetical protein XXXJIFNMEKO3_00108 [Candidatus Erwinia impunctatus]|nr:hypothetical protein XXXJIFNMEKO_00108 [Culicoides impunctatus]